ncbi:Uncharacterised protein [Klebsiella pneumoniae]|uniref:Uncharacterized protein n=1 Tax=Klebsiella pneumoniae TaxID=573 RepID=A0A4P0Y270_KLEPN|nr:Uncharacterised protein [Klebsiella pneumoniae]
MVAAVGEFQMPARFGRAEHYPAESFMIGKAAEQLDPSPAQYMLAVVSSSLTGLAMRI